MIGWNTTATATTALTSYKVTADATLYAVFQSCGDGYYTNDSGNGCTQCPEGKRSGGPGSSVSDCVDDNVKCSAGYYLKKGASSCTKCEKNYYCPGGTYAKKDGGGRNHRVRYPTDKEALSTKNQIWEKFSWSLIYWRNSKN